MTRIQELDDIPASSLTAIVRHNYPICPSIIWAATFLTLKSLLLSRVVEVFGCDLAYDFDQPWLNADPL